jgi:SSS family solute:Na+ symporter
MLGICAVVILGEGITPADSVIPLLAKEVLPIGIASILLAAMVAAVMSTGDSYLNSAVTSLERDLIRPFYTLSPKGEVWFGRVMTLVIGILAMLWGVAMPSIINALIYSYYFWAPTIWFPLVVAVLWKKVTPYAGLGGMIGGGIGMAIWTWVLNEPKGIGGALFRLCCSVVCLLIVQVITKNVKPIRGLTPLTKEQLGIQEE